MDKGGMGRDGNGMEWIEKNGKGMAGFKEAVGRDAIL